MMVILYLILMLGQLICFCEDNNNRIIVSKAESGAFIKSFTVCEEVSQMHKECVGQHS